ncbi:hypothetical protein [Flavobacterium branchiicola]|uniref:DUF4760 domain-containing protein n=1 Tax=Flavobacterium branchiicola TaxID=1114875 RepID=A0ABV9PF09_9FLAO|nr:hypothetical protein [Flavobacterium branchiicola]MBS7254701.1 hypothetical protein [Flavobacterium branchiicola]
MTRKEIYLVVSIACIFIFIPTCLFLNTFIKSTISDDISKWGAFGDYFGGILNCLSLFVTIYIAIKISNIEDNRNKENLKFEKQKLLREFRESEYKRINLELQKVWLGVTETDKNIAESIIYAVMMQYRYFTTSNRHLFDFLEDREIYDLKKSIDEIFNVLRRDDKSNLKSTIVDFGENLDKFNHKCQNFLLEN